MDLSEFFPMWNKLTDTERKTLADSAYCRTFSKGDTLHRGGTECTGLVLVKSGQLRAYTTSQDGKEITLYRLFERDMCLLSASCMMKGIQFSVTLTAEKDTEALVIPAEIYKSVMKESAPLANFTNEVIASRLTETMWLIEQIMWKSFDRRLAAFLAEESAIENGNVLKITHEIIGNHLGSPREVVTRMLKYFADEGLVRLSRGTIEILDEEALRTLADK